MEQKQQPHGFLYEPVNIGKDYVFGSALSLSRKLKGEVLNPEGNWTPYLPEEELQWAPGIETNSCVTFATLNCIEILKKRIFDKTKNLSDRKVAKGSGTDPLRGNYPRVVADYIRKNWSVYEEEYPFVNDVAEYYKPIPQVIKTLAISRGLEYGFGYEYVGTHKASLKEALKYSPVGMAVPAWAQDENGLYYRPQGWWDNHYVTLINIKPNGNYVIFDSYEPHIKEIREDVIPSMCMRYYLKRNVVNEGAWQRFIQWIRHFLFGEERPPEEEKVPEPVAEEPKYKWDIASNVRNSIRAICTEEGLSEKETAIIVAVIQAESGFNTQAVNKNRDGTYDYGLCQYNSYWYIDRMKLITKDQALNDPEYCVRLMIRRYRQGFLKDWVAYSSGAYIRYL